MVFGGGTDGPPTVDVPGRTDQVRVAFLAQLAQREKRAIACERARKRLASRLRVYAYSHMSGSEQFHKESTNSKVK